MSSERNAKRKWHESRPEGELTTCCFGCVQESRAREHVLERQAEHPHLWGLNSSDFKVPSLTAFCPFLVPKQFSIGTGPMSGRLKIQQRWDSIKCAESVPRTEVTTLWACVFAAVPCEVACTVYARCTDVVTRVHVPSAVATTRCYCNSRMHSSNQLLQWA